MDLGDFRRGVMVDFSWDTSLANGASANPTVAGTISVYKGNSVTQVTTGVTDDRAFDGIVGHHHCRVDLASDATFYAPGNDFRVVLTAATIDGQTVNATLAHFSIENRSPTRFTVRGAAIAGTLSTMQMTTDLSESTVDHYKGKQLLFIDGALDGQQTEMLGNDSAGKLTFMQLTEAPIAGQKFVLV
jgi:hypothetical protein